MALTLNPSETRWVDYIARAIVPRLEGSAAERARTAAIVTWWALKEGILDLSNPLRHNLCTQGGGDVRLGDLDVCAGPIWQLGISGIQGNNVSLAQVEQVTARLYPREDLASVLRDTARDAGLDANAAETVAQSTGQLRKSWLLRNGPIAFTLQRPFVEAGCVTGNQSWCHGRWDTARAFAGSPERVREVVADLEQQFASSGSRLLPWLLVLSGIGLAGYWWWDTSGRARYGRSLTRAFG